MKFKNPLKKEKNKATEGRFSDFLLNASPKEREQVFTDAAKRANKDQQEVLRQANLDSC